MKLKNISIFLLISCIILPLTACSYNIARPIEDETEIELWTYPIGEWGKEKIVNKLIKNFRTIHPEITVKVRCLNYKTGDIEINEAIKRGKAPNIVLEGPERIVANWGTHGLMEDLSDLYTDDSKDIYQNVLLACSAHDGKRYIYPLCMATHCMSINKRMFKDAAALKYVNLINHTWTTEDFFKAVDALYNHGHKKVISIYCNRPNCDQGSRALINNLYNGSFTDKAHRRYTIDSNENIVALSALSSRNGISVDTEICNDDENRMFLDGELAMSICWSPAKQYNAFKGKSTKTNTGDEIIPMQFPSPNGISKLVGGIWGFGVFKNDDENKVKASRLFVEYMTNDPDGVTAAVTASHFFPVHKKIIDLYDHTKEKRIMKTFLNHFMPSMGDYYQITPGWDEVRPLWTETLKEVASGMNIRSSLAECNQKANEIADRVISSFEK